MTGSSESSRQARESARQAQQANKESARIRAELQAQTKLAKQQADRETLRAQRLLMRSLRAAGGGFFETDAPQQSTLGSSGVLG